MQKVLVKEIYCEHREGPTKVSFITPVFNQESIISEVIRSISENSSLNSEILVLDDNSDDSTSQKCIEALREVFRTNLNVKRVKLYKSRIQIFETLSDSILIQESNSEVIIEIQADITILEMNFDAKIHSHFEKNEKLAIISGRGIDDVAAVKSYLNGIGSEISLGATIYSHFFFLFLKIFCIERLFKAFRYKIKSYKYKVFKKAQLVETCEFDEKFLPFPSIERFNETGRAGRLGRFVDKEYDGALAPNRLYIGKQFRSVVMRGPLALKKSIFYELGGLDFMRFFQGFDDADLCVRIHESGKWKIAYCPVGFSAPLTRGSMRKKKSRIDLFLITLHLCRIGMRRRSSSLFKFLKRMSNVNLEEEEL